MFELTTCAIIKPDGRDCHLTVMEDATVPLCVDHMREAYLFFAGHLQSMREFTAEQRGDWERMGQRDIADFSISERPSTVYYVLIGNHVKIGVTTDLDTRMKSLMVDDILALEPGDRDLEQRRHRQFAHLRASKGKEYFNLGDDLRAHIQALKEVGWTPPEPPVEVPGYVRGIACSSCDLLALWYDGTTSQCQNCGTVDVLPNYPPANAVIRPQRAILLNPASRQPSG